MTTNVYILRLLQSIIFVVPCSQLQEKFEDTKGIIKSEGGRTDNRMAKRIYKPRSIKTIYRKARYEQYELIKNTCDREEYAVPSPLVAPVVLLLLKHDKS